MVEFLPVVGVTANGETVTHADIERIEVDGVLVGFAERDCPIALIRSVSESERAEIDARSLARTGKARQINGPPSPVRVEETEGDEDDE